MGVAPSTGPMDTPAMRLFFDPTDQFRAGRGKLKGTDEEEPGCDALAAYCVLGDIQDQCIVQGSAALQQLRALSGHVARDERCCVDVGAVVRDRSLGCILGNIVGDALGAPLEFAPVRYGVAELKGMDHHEMWEKQGYNSFGLKPGQWTDDGSMALCIMDSLLCCNGFDGHNVRQRLHAWNKHGYNNAFGRDAEGNGRGSVGLGGNISMSMNEWERLGLAETSAGDQYTSGNGSVMRNGAVPVWFRNDLEGGMSVAAAQSRTTHAGIEAAELCRLLTFVCIGFINGAKLEFLEDLTAFKSSSYAVTCLARAQCEDSHEQNSAPIFGGLERRRWDWKDPDHKYCAHRAADNPGYCGSYAMDAMSMALHCIYWTKSFPEATLKAANLCGDADTVCAVTGQLAGALYGISAIPTSWVDRVQQWDDCTIVARALKLYNHEAVGCDPALSDSACASAKFLGIACDHTKKQEVKAA